ncbi:TetR/AcrR family transcriptional regulator [Hyphomonas sp. NPDC076900]|uniref:TetR/AcrR family transcriptional regulator n=1 Tax=unclassified Hyphomonas TaxID=2630699 RepID=UPI003D034A84
MKQHERRQQSSDKLINACLELASEQGVSALTFDNIGLRAGYSRNLAFQKFGSKGGLLEAVINHLHEVMSERRRRQDLDSLPGLDALLLYCDVHIAALDKTSEMKAYFILMSEAIAAMSDMREKFVGSHLRSATELMRIIRLGREDGSIRKDVNVEMAARLIGTQLIGISSQYLIEPSFNLKKARKELHQVIRAAYGTGPESASSRKSAAVVSGR